MLALNYARAFGDAPAEAKAQAVGIDYRVGDEVVEIANPTGGIYRVVAFVEDIESTGGPRLLMADIKRKLTTVSSDNQRLRIVEVRLATAVDRARQTVAQVDPLIVIASKLVRPGKIAMASVSIGVLAAVGAGAFLLYSRNRHGRSRRGRRR